MRPLFTLLLALGCMLVIPSHAQSHLSVGVAANFVDTLTRLATLYQQENPKQVIDISPASTGKLLHYLSHGAPIDVVFLANDALRWPRYQSLLMPGSVITYAWGRLVFASRSPVYENFPYWLGKQSALRISMAHAQLAPYGHAAEQTLAHYHIDSQHWQVVRGNNINQSLHFLLQGGLDGGFIALSQWLKLKRQKKPSFPTSDAHRWLVPASSHQPIAQTAGISARSPNLSQAQQWLAFCQRADIQKIIQNSGYHIHPPKEFTS